MFLSVQALNGRMEDESGVVGYCDRAVMTNVKPKKITLLGHG